MEIPGDSKVCPICGYEFPSGSPGLKWIALLLALFFLLYIILF